MSLSYVVLYSVKYVPYISYSRHVATRIVTEEGSKLYSSTRKVVKVISNISLLKGLIFS
jgi:hypothetical protein